VVRRAGAVCGRRSLPPVQYGGKTYIPGQANNLYIFPAIGLAVYATRAKRITDEMFIAAAHGVAEQVTPAELKMGLLYPPQTDILQTEIATAQRVAELIFERNLAGVERPADLRAFLENAVVQAGISETGVKGVRSEFWGRQSACKEAPDARRTRVCSQIVSYEAVSPTRSLKTLLSSSWTTGLTEMPVLPVPYVLFVLSLRADTGRIQLLVINAAHAL